MNPLFQIILGYILADFIVGIIHWFEDTYLDYDINIPFFDEIAKANELHHYFPRTIVGKSYFENIKTNLLLIFVIFVIFVIFFSKSLLSYPFFYASFFLFGLFSNIIHKWSHMRECELPGLIIFLQNTGFFCGHQMHRMHHSENNSLNYCVISSYFNFILDNIGFWRFLENSIYFITGIQPNRKGKFDDYKEIHTYIHENAKMECPDVPTQDEINTLMQTLDEYMRKKRRRLE